MDRKDYTGKGLDAWEEGYLNGFLHLPAWTKEELIKMHGPIKGRLYHHLYSCAYKEAHERKQRNQEM
jgi:hypothetical protein